MAFAKREAAIRITAVTAFVAALGAVSGAVTGVLLFVFIDAVMTGSVFGRGFVSGWAAAAGLGAIVGALIGTPIALLLLRRVPLWRATVETAGAAGLGAAAAMSLRIPYSWAYGALLFALLAA